MSARSCVLFLTGPHTSQEFISQVLSQFDANLSGDIPCCIITSSGEAPLWCGTESPGPADSQETTWSTSLAGLKFDEEKLKAGSLDNVGITLHNLLDEIPKYNVIHAVWITEQIPTAGASLILASGLMRFIKCHHGYLSIVSQSRDTNHSPWVKAMKAAVLLKSDVHNLAKIISKCCWVTDINFRGTGQSGVDMTLTGIVVMGKHTDFVTNGNLTLLSVIQIVNSVPLYILKECVDVTTVAMDTARRLATLTTRGILCKVTYQREQGIKLKSEWIRAVQTRSIGNSANTTQGPYVLLWRGKLYTFRDVLQPPSTQKGGVFINQNPRVDWSHEQKLLEFFERAAVESTKTDKSFPVRIPSPRNTPAAASVPSPMDFLSNYDPSSFKSDNQDSSGEEFHEQRTASLPFRDVVNLQTHGINYFNCHDDSDERIQELQRKFVHRETYCSLSPYNTEEKREYKSATSKSNKDSRFYRTSSNNSEKSVSGKGKCKASTLDRSKSLSHLPSCSSSVKIEPRHAKSSENIAQFPSVTESRNTKSTEVLPPSSSEVKPESSGVSSNSETCGTLKPSRSQKNKTLLKSVIAECLASEGIAPDHPRFKSLSSKLYDIGKLMLKDSTSGSEGIKDTMLAIIKPQANLIVQLEKHKGK